MIGTPLLERNWYRIWVSVDCESGTVNVGQLALNGPGTAKATESAKLDGSAALSRCADHDRRHRG